MIDREVEWIQSIWINDEHRRTCALCPNCLAQRANVPPQEHASWCSIARQFDDAPHLKAIEFIRRIASLATSQEMGDGSSDDRAMDDCIAEARALLA